jgi:hypothetical protein
MKTPKIGTHSAVPSAAEGYERLAAADERAAVGLLRAGEYRHALYQVVQGMEKRIRATAARLGSSPEASQRKIRGHSLKEALDALVWAVSSDDLARRQVEDLLFRDVLEGIPFADLHNDLRYPIYLVGRRSFVLLDVSRADVEAMLLRSRRLQAYLADIDRLRSASRRGTGAG